MSLPELSIRRPVMAWMLMAAIVLFGCLSFQRMGISPLPDVDYPVVSVSLRLPEASPEVIESQVVDPVEDAVTIPIHRRPAEARGLGIGVGAIERRRSGARVGGDYHEQRAQHDALHGHLLVESCRLRFPASPVWCRKL